MKLRHFLMLGSALGLAVSLNAAPAPTASNVTAQAPVKAAPVAVKPAVTQVNINTATVKELVKVKGISKRKAKAIVSYRKKHGDFASVDDLTKVKCISKKSLKKIADKLAV